MELDTIVVGDCLDVMAGMPDGCVSFVIADPPYAVNKGFKGEDFNEAQLFQLLDQIAAEFKRICKPNTNILIDASIQKLPLFLNAFLPHLNYMWQLIWYQPNRMGSRSKAGFGAYSSFLWFSNGVGKRVKVAKDVFKCSTRGGQQADWVRHPAPKSVDVYGRWIEILSHKGNLVFDPFMGSGTTAVAALKLDRHFYGCDINPEYVKLANERVERARLESAQMKLGL